jgi:hypothetical protein
VFDQFFAIHDDGAPGADDIRHESFARELYPEDATAEVWSGNDEMMAEVLKSCLAEIGINCYVRTPESEGGDADSNGRTNKPTVKPSAPFAVCVLPQDESRARQIIREVTDGTPPQ